MIDTEHDRSVVILEHEAHHLQLVTEEAPWQRHAIRRHVPQRIHRGYQDRLANREQGILPRARARVTCANDDHNRIQAEKPCP